MGGYEKGTLRERQERLFWWGPRGVAGAASRQAILEPRVRCIRDFKRGQTFRVSQIVLNNNKKTHFLPHRHRQNQAIPFTKKTVHIQDRCTPKFRSYRITAPVCYQVDLVRRINCEQTLVVCADNK